MRMAWIVLFVAGLAEVAWAIGLKYTNAFTRLWPSIFTLVAMVISLALLAMATRQLPIGTAYPVWTGIGAAGTAVLGIWLFGESTSPARLLCIGMIVAGVVGLRLAH